VIGCEAPCEFVIITVAEPMALVFPVIEKGRVIVKLLPFAVDAGLAYQVVNALDN
jgi:hypothetical protein